MARARRGAPGKRASRPAPAPAPGKRKSQAPANPQGRRGQPARERCPLTGLPRGADALQRWREAVAASRARGEPCALALIDVDGMSGQVAALGPARADALLRGVAERLRQVLTDQSLLGRWAGDLFGLALPGVEVEPALGLLERARAAVAARPFRVGRGSEAREVAVTVSVGLAGIPRDARELPELLDGARAALWRAKGLGGNRLGLPARERMTLKTSYYAQRQLEQLKRLAARLQVNESVLLRDALEELLLRHKEPGAADLPAPAPRGSAQG